MVDLNKLSGFGKRNLDSIFTRSKLESMIEEYEKTQAKETIEDAVMDELLSIGSVPTGTVEIPNLKLTSTKVGDEEWEIEISGVIQSSIVKKGIWSPSIMVKLEGIIPRERPVINGKIPASSVKEDEVNSDLANPRLSTLGLSRDEVNNIKSFLDKEGIKYKDNSDMGLNQYIELRDIPMSSDLSSLGTYSGRITYPTTQESSAQGVRPFDPRTLTLSNPTIESMAEGSKEKLANSKAASIMSDTTLKVSEEYAKSLPDVVDGNADSVHKQLTKLRSDDFKRLKNAATELDPYIKDPKFADAASKGKSFEYQEKMSDSDNKKIEAIRKRYSITADDMKKIAMFDKNNLKLSDGRDLNMLTDTESFSESKTLSNQARRKSDNKMNFSLHTINGERMYVYGGDSFLDNTDLRENIAFEPNKKKAKQIALSDKKMKRYNRNLNEALGGALIEDKVIDGGKHKYSSYELENFAKDFMKSDIDYDSLSPRIKTLINAKKKAEKGEVDTSTAVTLDATFSGLVVTSGILGRKDGLDKVNIVPEGEKVKEMHDLYTEVGKDLIKDLTEYGMDSHAARKLVKPGVMPAMYNSSQRARATKLREELKDYFHEKTDMSESEIKEAITKLNPNIQKTTQDATTILMGKVNPKSIIGLNKKGIVKLYKPKEGTEHEGEVEEIKNPTEDDLLQVSAYKIKHPDGKVSYSARTENKVSRTIDGKISVTKDALSVPYAKVNKITKEGKASDRDNMGLLMNSMAPGIARHMDSYVASTVIEKMHDKGVPIVTVHDAMIVPVYAMDTLKDTYNDAVNSLYEYTGSDIRVDARNNLSVE